MPILGDQCVVHEMKLWSDLYVRWYPDKSALFIKIILKTHEEITSIISEFHLSWTALSPFLFCASGKGTDTVNLTAKLARLTWAKVSESGSASCNWEPIMLTMSILGTGYNCSPLWISRCVLAQERREYVISQNWVKAEAVRAPPRADMPPMPILGDDHTCGLPPSQPASLSPHNYSTLCCRTLAITLNIIN